jgi:hypothetical protein
MNTQTQEALKMAIGFAETSSSISGELYYQYRDIVINACKEALEQPAQGNKEFVTLTDDEIVAKVFDNDELLARILYLDGVSKGLEQALKEKNT